MRLRFIHAMTGSSQEFLTREKEILLGFASPGTEIEICKIKNGAASIESKFDIYIGAVETLQLVKEAEEQGFDGVVVTCFGNANIEPARELVSIPVVGSGMAAMLLAASLGHKFSVVATLPAARRRHELEAWKTGVHQKLASVRDIGTRVLAIEDNVERTKQAMIETGRKCIEEDGAEVLVPGCFGFIGLAREMQEVLGVPVIDPAGAAVRLVETLVKLGLSQSKLSYPTPPPKSRAFGF
jgi:allantoin racemase